jgi:hypothetical protein
MKNIPGKKKKSRKVPIGSQKNYQDCRSVTGSKTSMEQGRSKKIKFRVSKRRKDR